MFKLLGDPTRLMILLTISEGEKCVHEIAKITDSNISNISHHLRKMRDHDLVEYRKKGRHKFYRLKDHRVVTIIREGIAHARE